MNALYKLVGNRGLLNPPARLRVLLSSTLVIGLICVMSINVQAAICYADAKQAYAYLLEKEKSETQALEQAVVDINSASEGELVSLNGIGSSKAQEIILYREMFGDFSSVDELEKVKGIGAKTIEKNRSRLYVQP